MSIAEINTKPQTCPECGGNEGKDDIFQFDPFDFGILLDEHMDAEVDQEALGKRMADAMEMARKLGGRLPGGIEGELEELIKPKLTWQDFVRFIKAKKKHAERKNDWNTPRRKPLFSGLYVPKKIDYTVKFAMIYDCSGSMSKEQITYGISQTLALGDRGEGWAIPFDSGPFYDSMVKLKNAKSEELRNAKYKGGGGTMLSPVLTSYEKEIGHVDIIIVISDFHLADEAEVIKFVPPKNTEIVWLSVGGNLKFKPIYGRKFDLMNE